MEKIKRESTNTNHNNERHNMTTTTDTPQAATPDNALAGELLTLHEVAKILKVSRKTLYAWKAAGKIRFCKICGSLIRIPRADLTALITREDGGKTPAA